MKINSYNIEFGYELLSAVPYAYELYLKGQLTETESAIGSEALYYFSPKHKINKSERSWFNTQTAKDNGLPYTIIHSHEQPEKTFPPYKEHYANKEFKFKKPTLCICNRYNIEWSTKAVNYFDEAILDWMFINLKKQYEIVYMPVDLPKELQDSVEPLKLNDIEVCKKHNVKILTNLIKDDWNTTLLKVFANCEHFITMNGGYSILASMFSGTNIIYSVPGELQTREIANKSFWRWYPNINNVRTLHVPSYKELKEKITSLYIKKEPCLNILVRTHRPNYLNKCIESINSQSYQNINLVLICDSKASVISTRSHNARVLKVELDRLITNPPNDSQAYGRWFPYNKYLDYAQRKVNGYILMLDDDDMLTSNDSVLQIMESVKEDTLTIWDVDMKQSGIIPSNFKGIELYNITGIGFCYHSSQIHLTDWSQWKRADYRTAKKLSENLKVNYIPKILTGIQDFPGGGTKKDLQSEDYNSIEVIMVRNGQKSRQEFVKSEFPEIEKALKLHGYTFEPCTELTT